MNINAEDIKEFFDAVVYGDRNKVVQMIKANQEFVNAKDEFGFTALHSVMDEENFDIVQYLILHGADVNSKNDEGITPLHCAGWKENARLLLNAGADIDALDNEGNSPLHLAVSDGMESFGVIKLLLANGAKINLKNNFGATPLDIAIMRKEFWIIGFLRLKQISKFFYRS